MIVRDVFGTRCGRVIAKALTRSSYVPAPSLTWTQRRFNQHVVRNQRPFRLAIIGSGPAGFYSALKVMSLIQDAVVDMYEQLPVPFGLVRFGVAPDHPEVKNCQDRFTEVASSPRFNFIGNVDVGRDLLLSSLVPQYDACLFAYGASKDRRLNVPGEDTLSGIYSARAFVGWYNGLPEYAALSPNLDAGDTAVIIGQGNVALDVARTLLSDVDRLKNTDMTEHALAVLAKSRIKRVHVVGRRGPMQASFTIKEVRELTNLPGVSFAPIDTSLTPPEPGKLPRMQKRLTQLLLRGSATPSTSASRSWSIDFLLSPTSFSGTSSGVPSLTAVNFARTAFEGQDPFDAKTRVRNTDEHTSIPASTAFKSIGYKSESLPGMADLGIPFDSASGTIPNFASGRILTDSSALAASNSQHLPGMYCTGWVKNGPTGVIASTMEDAFASAEAISEDWERKIQNVKGAGPEVAKEGWDALKDEVEARGVRSVSWEDWERIDRAEKDRGRARGKEREKFASVDEMLRVTE
ncbi:NADPH-adrenodoxin reductase [Trapelia coarctata]|nr:NADPH-adrenodoxin reductase [Trapelia coarctata]